MLIDGEKVSFIEEEYGYAETDLKFTFYDNPQPLSESLKESVFGPAGDYKVIGIAEGVFFPIGGTSRNGRIYEEDHWTHVLGQDHIKNKISRRGMLGTIGHHDKKVDNADFANGLISHVISHLVIDEAAKVGKGRLEILDTEAGRNLKAGYEAGLPIYVSTRGAGKLKRTMGEGLDVVDKHNYFFETVDIVLDPGFLEAQPMYRPDLLQEGNNKKEQESDSILEEKTIDESLKDNKVDEIIEDKIDLTKYNMSAVVEDILQQMFSPIEEKMNSLSEGGLTLETGGRGDGRITRSGTYKKQKARNLIGPSAVLSSPKPSKAVPEKIHLGRAGTLRGNKLYVKDTKTSPKINRPKGDSTGLSRQVTKSKLITRSNARIKEELLEQLASLVENKEDLERYNLDAVVEDILQQMFSPIEEKLANIDETFPSTLVKKGFKYPYHAQHTRTDSGTHEPKKIKMKDGKTRTPAAPALPVHGSKIAKHFKLKQVKEELLQELGSILEEIKKTYGYTGKTTALSAMKNAGGFDKLHPAKRRSIINKTKEEMIKNDRVLKGSKLPEELSDCNMDAVMEDILQQMFSPIEEKLNSTLEDKG